MCLLLIFFFSSIPVLDVYSNPCVMDQVITWKHSMHYYQAYIVLTDEQMIRVGYCSLTQQCSLRKRQTIHIILMFRLSVTDGQEVALTSKMTAL